MLPFPEHPLFTVGEATAPPVPVAVELPFTPVVAVVAPDVAAAFEFHGAKEMVVCTFGYSDNVTNAVPGSVKALPGKLLRGSDPGIPDGKFKELSTLSP